MGPKQFGPAIAPVTMNIMPEVPGADLKLDPETEEMVPIRNMTGKWGEFTLDWDDATQRQLSGFYLRWVTGGEGWTWPSGTWVQQWAQFENPIKPGNFRAVTCNTLYNRKHGGAMKYVKGYKGRRPFTDDFVGRNVSWNNVNALDYDKYATWEADPFSNRQATSYQSEFKEEWATPEEKEDGEEDQVWSRQTCTAAIIFDWQEKGEEYYSYRDEFIMSIKEGVTWQVQVGWRTWIPNTSTISEAYESEKFPMALSALVVEPADFDISEMLQWSSRKSGIFSGDQMGSFSEEMIDEDRLPLDHSVSRNIKSWSSAITTHGNWGQQGGYGNIEPADVVELPTTFTSVPEDGTLKAELAWDKMHGISEFPRTFHSQDMTGMQKTTKSLTGMADEEIRPIIEKHDKLVRTVTFWTTLIFCFFFSCALGGTVTICMWAVAWGIPFDIWWNTKGKKWLKDKAPCGLGRFIEAAQTAGDQMQAAGDALKDDAKQAIN